MKNDASRVAPQGDEEVNLDSAGRLRQTAPISGDGTPAPGSAPARRNPVGAKATNQAAAAGTLAAPQASSDTPEPIPHGELDDEQIMRGLRREVEEEVEVERELSLVPVGVINEETNEVGSVHLGFMFRMEVAGEVRVRETEKLEGLWVPKSELPALREQLEGWSKIAMEAIV